jgi:hypothetical protein
MKRFPDQFSDLLTPYGMRVLKGQVQEAISLFRATDHYFVNLERIVDKKKRGNVVNCWTIIYTRTWLSSRVG